MAVHSYTCSKCKAEIKSEKELDFKGKAFKCFTCLGKNKNSNPPSSSSVAMSNSLGIIANLNSELTVKLEAKETEIKELQNSTILTISSLKSEIEDLKAKDEALETRNKKLEEEKNKIQRTFNYKLNRETNDIKKKFGSLENTVSQLRDSKQNLKAKFDASILLITEILKDRDVVEIMDRNSVIKELIKDGGDVRELIDTIIQKINKSN